MPRDPEIRAIYHSIQNEFDALDKRVGSHGKRLMAITELPQLARDLYLVHDIVAITCISGAKQWICYHHDEPGWMDSAVEAFARIGYAHVGEGMRTLLPICLAKWDKVTWDDERIPSDFIMAHEEEIMRSLHAYLVRNGYATHIQLNAEGQ